MVGVAQCKPGNGVGQKPAMASRPPRWNACETRSTWLHSIGSYLKSFSLSAVRKIKAIYRAVRIFGENAWKETTNKIEHGRCHDEFEITLANRGYLSVGSGMPLYQDCNF
jgi:hypothetical protein